MQKFEKPYFQVKYKELGKWSDGFEFDFESNDLKKLQIVVNELEKVSYNEETKKREISYGKWKSLNQDGSELSGFKLKLEFANEAGPIDIRICFPSGLIFKVWRF